MICDLYLRNNIIHIPTMGRMDKGFYRAVEPVAVVAVSNTEALRQALSETIARGNPQVPMLRRREIPAPNLLKYAGVKSWSAFERGMRQWAIVEKDRNFQIAEQEKKSDGMWRDDSRQIVDFPSGATVDEVVDRMIAILQAAARR